MIEESVKNNKGFINEGRANFYLTKAENLPFDDGIFHKVFSVNTLYFWDKPESVLSEIKRVLKPGGVILTSIRPKSVMQDYPFAKHGFNLFSKQDLADLLSVNGFNVTTVLERKEPDQDVNGNKVIVETLIVGAEKLG